MSYCDYDPPEVYSTQERTCRKPCHCCECGMPIERGERYLRCSGKWDGDFTSFAQHLDCANACMFIRDHNDGECIAFGELMTWWAEQRRECRGPVYAPLRKMMAGIFRRRRLTSDSGAAFGNGNIFRR